MFYASIETFCRKWEEEILPKLFFIFKQLEKCQNEYYPESLCVPMRLCASVVYVPTGLREMCQKHADFSCLRANVPYDVPMF